MPQRPIQYADEDLDRVAERRTDARWVRERLADPHTRVAAVARRRHPFRPGVPPVPVYLSPGDAAASTGAEPPILLGVRAGVAWFAVDVAEDALARLDGVELLGLRDAVADLAPADAAVLAYAGALVHWHATHRFCPACGHATAPERAGHARRCLDPACARQHFPRTDPAVITLVVDGERCLLARRRIWPVNRRSTIAGFVEPGETLEHAVRREIREEVGVRVGDVRYRGSQPWPFPASLMLGFRATAETVDVAVDGDEIAEADWYTRARIRDEVAAGTLLLPPADSISRRLVADWMDES